MLSNEQNPEEPRQRRGQKLNSSTKAGFILFSTTCPAKGGISTYLLYHLYVKLFSIIFVINQNPLNECT